MGHPMDFECPHDIHWFDCPEHYAEIDAAYGSRCECETCISPGTETP